MRPMEQNLQNTVLLLSRTPAALNALLRDLPETWTLRNEGEAEPIFEQLSMKIGETV